MNEECIKKIAGNAKLNMKEKGLLLTLLAMEEDENPTAQYIAEHYVLDGHNTVSSALRDLEAKGLIYRKRLYEDGKYMGMKITVNCGEDR